MLLVWTGASEASPKKKHKTRKGRSNKNGDGDASCRTYINMHRKRMADYDVSVYKDVLMAFSELTLFFCAKNKPQIVKVL